MKSNLIALLFLVLIAGCASLRSDLSRDSALRGEWLCDSAVIDGKALSSETTRALRLKLTSNRYVTTKGNETLFDSSYRVDRSKSPAQIFMIGTEGTLTGKEAQGIYEISGDTLSICYALPGDPPPRTFESAPGLKAHFVIWRRTRK